MYAIINISKGTLPSRSQLIILSALQQMLSFYTHCKDAGRLYSVQAKIGLVNGAAEPWSMIKSIIIVKRRLDEGHHIRKEASSMRDFKLPGIFDKNMKDSSSAGQETRLRNVETEKTIPFKKVWEKLKRAGKTIISALSIITATINNSCGVTTFG